MSMMTMSMMLVVAAYHMRHSSPYETQRVLGLFQGINRFAACTPCMASALLSPCLTCRLPTRIVCDAPSILAHAPAWGHDVLHPLCVPCCLGIMASRILAATFPDLLASAWVHGLSCP